MPRGRMRTDAAGRTTPFVFRRPATERSETASVRVRHIGRSGSVASPHRLFVVLTSAALAGAGRDLVAYGVRSAVAESGLPAGGRLPSSLQPNGFLGICRGVPGLGRCERDAHSYYVTRLDSRPRFTREDRAESVPDSGTGAGPDEIQTGVTGRMGARIVRPGAEVSAEVGRIAAVGDRHLESVSGYGGQAHVIDAHAGNRTGRSRQAHHRGSHNGQRHAYGCHRLESRPCL